MDGNNLRPLQRRDRSSDRRLINRTLTQTQECITDTTITNRIKQGDVRWNWEETTRNVPSRDEISLGRPASLPELPAWCPLFQRHS
jgi:hypothetical protein